jgi:hypothetical protein
MKSCFPGKHAGLEKWEIKPLKLIPEEEKIS